MPCTVTTSWTTRDEGQLRTGALPNRNEEIVNQEINRNEVYAANYIAKDDSLVPMALEGAQAFPQQSSKFIIALLGMIYIETTKKELSVT